MSQGSNYDISNDCVKKTCNRGYGHGTEVINKDYSVRYRPGDDISAKEKTIADMMQADIEKYKSEQQIYLAAALDTAVTNVQKRLETDASK